MNDICISEKPKFRDALKTEWSILPVWVKLVVLGVVWAFIFIPVGRYFYFALWTVPVTGFAAVIFTLFAILRSVRETHREMQNEWCAEQKYRQMRDEQFPEREE